MQAAEPRELGFGQPRNCPKNAQLLTVLQLRLEPHHVEQRTEPIVLAQLHDGISLDVRTTRVCQSERFHRPMP